MSDQEFIEKVKKGVQLAFEKLVRKERLRNGKLVFSYNGKVELVPARKVRISTDK
jgi:hypothetical protein